MTANATPTPPPRPVKRRRKTPPRSAPAAAPPSRGPDYLAFPAFVLLWACLGWIACDIYQFMSARQELVRQVNRAVELGNSGKWEDALAQLRSFRADVRRTDKTPAGVAAGTLRNWSPDFDNAFATLYANLGRHDVAAQESELAIRAFTLALLHDPLARDVGGPLALECFATRNDELGAVACTLALKYHEQVPPKLPQLFQRHLPDVQD